MPAPVTMTIVTGRLAVGLTPPDVATPLDAYDCQVVSGAVVPQPKLNTVRATFCAPESQAPGATGWQLDITVLQDWSADATSFTWFSIDNDTAEVYWELELDTGAATADAVTMHGMAYVVAFQFGGDAGTPLEASQTWPIIGRPEKGPWPLAMTAEEEAPDLEREPEPTAA